MCCRSILFISVWTILITFKVIQSPFNQQIWLSSPRYNVGTAMPILVDFVFQFLRLRTYKSSITLLLFLIYIGKSCLRPFAKLRYFSDNLLCLSNYLYFEHEINCRTMFERVILAKMSIPFPNIKSAIG